MGTTSNARCTLANPGETAPKFIAIPGYNLCRRWLKQHHVVGVIILPDNRVNYCAADFDYQ